MHDTNNNNGEVDDMEFDINNNNTMNNTDQPQYQSAKAAHQNQSPNKSSPPNTAFNKSNTTNNQQYKDGLEVDDDDSDATTCDGSVDLLADDDTNTTNSQYTTENANLKNKRGVSRSIGSGFNRDFNNNGGKGGGEDEESQESVSPATQTLDRLSMFGSQEGGAELCIHLLKNTNDDSVAKNVDTNGVCTVNNANSHHCTKPSGNMGETDGGGRQQKQTIIQDLKEYFMSTNNSSIYAEQQSTSVIPPMVPFCQKCNNSASISTSTVQSQLSQSTTTSRTIPHHSLCPHNPDFYNSGSYEILNLIVDGNLLGCSSCIYQFNNGKLNKQLVHEGGCKRGGSGGGKKKKGVGVKGGKDNSRGSKSMVSSPLPKSIIGGRGSSTRPNVQLTPTHPKTPSTKTTLGQQQKTITLGQQKITNATNYDGPFDVGTIVYIEDRMWPGRNDPGGVARVVKVHHRTAKATRDEDRDSGESKRTYDVKYVLESRKEKNVEEDYMTLHTDYVSPSKDCSGGLICEDSQVGGSAAKNESAVSSGGGGGINDEMQLASPALVDANGHPLSEYERLRLRNIQRNKARLASLGLLVPPGQQQGGAGSSNNGKASTTSNRVSLEVAAKSGCTKCTKELQSGVKEHSTHDNNCPRKKRVKQQDDKVERRSQPIRQNKVKQPSEVEEDGKSKGRASVAEGAKSGCRKCIKELETGEKTRGSKHDVNCPRKEVPATLAEAAKSGCKKCVAELETGKKTGKPHDLNCPRKLAPRERKTSKEDKSEHQLLIQEEDVAGYLNRQNKQLSSTNNTTPLLVDGAKSGCQKCTLEWQTDEVNPSMSHDDCCPRVGKKVSLSNRPRLHSQNHGTSGSGSQRKPSLNKVRSSTSSTLTIGSRGTAGSSNSRKYNSSASSSSLVKATSHSFNSRNYSSSASSASSSVVKATSHSSTHRTYQPTPSPVPPSSSTSTRRDNNQQPSQQQQQPPQLPAWIREFISEADQHNRDFTIPPKSKWLPCPNPWGKIGHEGDDVVIMSPFESESTSDILSVFHQGPNRSMPKRFVANPFEEGSPYHDTHTSPSRGGYSVLRLMRDRMSLRPWGFTVRLHEFGGACLVDSIEPSSPAESAVDISGWSSADGTSSSGLKLHDMIICVNGKSVGSMTMPELIIELDVCGPEMMLVVSRFDVKESIAGGNKESMTLEDLAMDWTDIGSSSNNNSSLKRKRVSFENEQLGSSSSDGHEMNGGQTHHLQNDERAGYQLNDDDEENEYSAGQIENRIAKNDWQSPMRKVSDAPIMEKKTTQPRREQAVAHPVSIRQSMSGGGGEKRHTNDDDSDEDDEEEPVHSNSKYSKKISHPTPKRHISAGRETAHDEDMQISKSKKWPLCGISKPGKHDYLGGLSAPKSHPGNVKYRQTIEDNEDAHKALPSSDNESICIEIVQEWRSLDPPGRFLKKNEQTKLWDDIGDEEAKAKVQKSFENKQLSRSRSKNGNASKKKKTDRYQKQLEEESSDDESEVLPKRKRSVNKRKVVQPSIKEDDDDSVVNSDNDDDDNQQWKDGNGEDDPWLGCVCGQTHPHPIKVFWVQCEGCDAWYNVAEECVGFDADAAEDLDEWRCWACDPPVEGMGL